MIQTVQPGERTFSRHYEESTVINASAEDVFAVIDDYAVFLHI